MYKQNKEASEMLVHIWINKVISAFYPNANKAQTNEVFIIWDSLVKKETNLSDTRQLKINQLLSLKPPHNVLHSIKQII